MITLNQYFIIFINDGHIWIYWFRIPLLLHNDPSIPIFLYPKYHPDQQNNRNRINSFAFRLSNNESLWRLRGKVSLNWLNESFCLLKSNFSIMSMVESLELSHHLINNSQLWNVWDLNAFLIAFQYNLSHYKWPSELQLFSLNFIPHLETLSLKWYVIPCLLLLEFP